MLVKGAKGHKLYNKQNDPYNTASFCCGLFIT